MSNVKWVNDANLCHGCGACDAVCPHGSITMVNSGKNKFPLIDMSCTDCTLCEQACSGYQTTIDTSILESDYIYIAYSKIEDIRHKSSSGGFITQYLLDLLEAKKIDGAIVTISDGTMQGTKAVIVTTRDEIIGSMGSKYYPSSNCSVLKNMDYSKKYAFVGKGCDLESLMLIKSVNKKIYNSIYVKIGLMCHHTPYSEETKKLIEKYGFKVSNKTKLTYRGDGWPGQTIIQNNKKEEKIDYKISWGENLAQNIPFRCQICTQSFAQNADITVGDAWSENKKLDNQNNGLSLVIANTELGIRELKDLQLNGNVYIEKSTKAVLLDSQENLLKKLDMSINKLKTLSVVTKEMQVIEIRNNFKANSVNILKSVKFILKYLKARYAHA
jgi:coenzyme F420 hydrogenase subunit beta